MATYFRKPPPMITYFVQPGSEEGGGSSRIESLRSESTSSFQLGVGFLGTQARDTATLPGYAGYSYAGPSLSIVWQASPEWVVRGGVGYAWRSFSLPDVTNGQALTGQYWMLQGVLEYQWYTSKSFRISSGWANLFSYGYRSQSLFANPSLGAQWYYKTGVSSMIRFSVGGGIDLYGDAQYLFGLGTPLETQALFGAGILIEL